MRKSYSLSAKLYILGLSLVASGFLGAALSTVDLTFSHRVIIAAVILGMISLVLEFIDFPLVIAGETSFSTVAYMAMVFMLPFPLPAIVGALVVAIVDLRSRKRALSILFNTSNFALTFGVTSLIWYLAYGARALNEIPTSVQAFAVVVLMVVAFYVINVLLTDILIAIVGNRSLKYIWLTNDLDFLLPFVCLEVVGVLAAVVWITAPVLVPLLIVPAVTTYLAFEMIHRLQNQTQQAMIAMADAIDQRDPYTADHSQRVSEMSVRIAEIYGMNERDTERLRIASRLHDIGKIGIGNDVLHKPGKLTEQEWQIMKSHPTIGEQMLMPYRQFRHETALIRSHHERWDGKGYPDGIRGTAIPLGARIIAVADTFDAMTTSRPYRPALSRQVAIDEIRNGALTQFDPQVVASFLQVMEEWSKVLPIPGKEHEVSEHIQVPAWFSSSQ